MERSGDFCWRNNGRGVDLNRNTDWEFNGKQIVVLLSFCLQTSY